MKTTYFLSGYLGGPFSKGFGGVWFLPGLDDYFGRFSRVFRGFSRVF